MIDTGLEGKVALVTGCNNPHGIGAAVARALAEQGAAVLAHYFRQHRTDSGSKEPEPDDPGLDLYYAVQAESADWLVREIREVGRKAECREADLREPGVVPELFECAERALGPVDVLVNNAAEYEADSFFPQERLEPHERALWEGGPGRSTLTAASHDRHFEANSRGVALMMAEFASRSAARASRWGRIVNVSADCSWGSPGEVSYRASKYALESFSRSAAAELGPLGITVNVVSPGPIQTGYISREMELELVKGIPLGRVGRSEDVAAAVLFLASEQAGWITGQLITVHGGHRMALGI